VDNLKVLSVTRDILNTRDISDLGHDILASRCEGMGWGMGWSKALGKVTKGFSVDAVTMCPRPMCG
jgi:hypothetical protein